MTKRTIILCSLIIFACMGCSDNGDGEKFSGRGWNANLTERNQALERAIIADVMGGIAADTIIPAELSIAGIPPLDDDIVIDPDLPEDTTTVSVQRSLTPVADSYQYPSVSGEGSLEIIISGDFEELDENSDIKRTIRFFPIEITFSFDKFDYVNSCGIPAVITGNISCKMQGEIHRASDIMVASGNCATGANTMAGTVVYELAGDEEHDLFVQTSIKANGPWYELTSYEFNGTYMLDRRTGMLDNVIARAASSCEY